MNIRIERVERLLARAAGRFISPGAAREFARLYVETHLRKAPRMNPLQEAVDDLIAWEKAGRTEPCLTVDKPGVMLWDLQGLPPSLKIKAIHDRLADKARANGIAAAGLVNTGGIITLNMWADGLAKRDLIGLAMFNGGTECAVPPGAKQGMLGTNPVAYAVPSAGRPMALDMATTEIPFFEIRQAKEAGTPLRPGAAVDRDGNPTIDAAAALDDDGRANLLPMGGGFKGFGIMMLVEVLTSALIGSPLSIDQASGWHPAEYGCFMIAIDPAAFTGTEPFKSGVERMGRAIRDLEPVSGPVSVPGDRGQEQMDAATAAGEIDLPASQAAALARLAGEDA